MRGKENCELLKALRKQIADANGIEYEPAVCTYEGDCPGYCPKCDEELQYLEEQIRAKQQRGEAVSVTNLELDRFTREKIRFHNSIKAKAKWEELRKESDDITDPPIMRNAKIMEMEMMEADRLEKEHLMGLIMPVNEINDTEQKDSRNDIDRLTQTLIGEPKEEPKDTTKTPEPYPPFVRFDKLPPPPFPIVPPMSVLEEKAPSPAPESPEK